jgi:hypothetical protein
MRLQRVPMGVFIIGIGTAVLLGGLTVALLVSFAQTPMWCGEDIEDAPCTREWISALGGWFGGLIALPTLFLLMRQTTATQQQVDQGKAPHYVRQVERLRAEIALGEHVRKSLNEEIGIDYTQLDLRVESGVEYAKTHAYRCARIVRRQASELAERLATNPLIGMEESRDRVRETLFAMAKDLSEIAGKLKQIHGLVRLDAGFLPRSNIQAIGTSLEYICWLDFIDPAIHSWNAAASREIQRYEMLLDQIHASH